MELTVLEHMRRCLVRQLIRWRVERNAQAIEAMRRMHGYEALKAEAERQWGAGNRGLKGMWVELLEDEPSKKINANPSRSTKI